MKKSTALKTLGLSEGASDDEIKKAHRKLIIENHPDKFGQDADARAKAEEKTKLINEARDVLLNRSWEPEYSTAGTPYGAPFSYDPFAAARGQNSQGSSTQQQGQSTGYTNPFADWPFSESFVWTTWDAQGNQHTYRSDSTQSEQNPFSANPFSGTNPFGSANPFGSSSPFSSSSTRRTGSHKANPYRSGDPFGDMFFDFANMFVREPSWEEKLKQAKADLFLDIKLIVAKLLILGLSILLSAPATGLYLYTIISIGQGIWKRLNFLSLIFLIPFTMLAIIFVPNSNTAINIFALILFACSVGFDISNVTRHAKRIRAIKQHIKK